MSISPYNGLSSATKGNEGQTDATTWMSLNRYVFSLKQLKSETQVKEANTRDHILCGSHRLNVHKMQSTDRKVNGWL